MRFLLDTNIVSELRRGPKGNAGVAAWAREVSEADCAISVITVKELEYGILNRARSDPDQGLIYRAWLDHVVLPLYRDRILAVDVVVARHAAAFDVPDPRPFGDGLIAATALVHGLTVVTRNVVHFRPMKVPVLNPFT